MPVEYIRMATERYDRLGYPTYRWYRADAPPPWTPLPKPLKDCRLGMMATPGAYVKGQVAYHYKDDTSTRDIPSDVDPADLRFSHITENYLPDARRDADCMVPVTALRRLRDEGVVGSLAENFFSCMGGVYSQRRVREELIPELAGKFRAQGVDCALLVAL